ncbi:low-density lipoprotein receptor-related protein 11-like, partial [Mustelus asterias]
MPGAWPLSCGLLAACLWLRAAAVGPGPLGEFGQQPGRAAGGWSPEAGAGASARCQSAFGLMQDHIIRTRDSLGAGASFLSAPTAISSPAQCLRSCCAFPGCTVAVVERGGLHWARGPEAASRPPAALSCYLFNCTARGRDVCRFSPHRGYSSFTRGPRPNHYGN